MHSIHTKNNNATILQVDLRKAFDFLNWGYLKLILYKIGLHHKSVEWIMACMMNVDYPMIINDFTSKKIRARHGLRQGCSFSPLLFILAMDGLSLHISKAMEHDHFQALKMGLNINTSHGVFIDDVLIMGMLNHFSQLCLFHIFRRFSNATGLYLNAQKSIVFHGKCALDIIIYIKNLFGIEAQFLCDGIKYLGYHMKPCKCRNSYQFFFC